VIYIHKKDGKGVYATIPGHTGVVTCVRFVQNKLMSGDDQGWLHLHQKQDGEVLNLTSSPFRLIEAILFSGSRYSKQRRIGMQFLS
jgi:hypothetical protein